MTAWLLLCSFLGFAAAASGAMQVCVVMTLCASVFGLLVHHEADFVQAALSALLSGTVVQISYMIFSLMTVLLRPNLRPLDVTEGRGGA